MDITESIDEAALVEAAQRGNLDAFNELILFYQHQVYNMAYYMLKDPSSADDATQETFISAYRALDSFRGGSFRAWLLRIVKNACYDEFRRRKRRPVVSWEDFGYSDEEANPRLADRSEPPESTIQRDELRQFIDRTMMKLPADQRILLYLVDRMGYAYDEAAEVLDIPLGTVKSRLARGRERMREFLQEEQELLPLRYRLEG